jgi:glutathione synthase
MTLNIGVIMDPLHAIDYKKDSTLAMLWEAQDRGWSIYYAQPHDLFYSNGKIMARLQKMTTKRNTPNWYQLHPAETVSMQMLDIVLMRKDPPFNMNYIYCTHLLEMAQQQGCYVINNPSALRNCNEKLFALQLPQLCPSTLVSSQFIEIQRFHQQQIERHQGEMILKPIDGMGGMGVFKINADGQNLAACVELLTHQGTTPIIAQQYLPAIKDGDKRILLINGDPIPYVLARIPQADTVRGNLAAGGRAEGRPLSEHDRYLCSHLKPLLQQAGILFAGIDVIGDHITEINITSPTCIQQLDSQFNLNISAQLLDCIAEQWAKTHPSSRPPTTGSNSDC